MAKRNGLIHQIRTASKIKTDNGHAFYKHNGFWVDNENPDRIDMIWTGKEMERQIKNNEIQITEIDGLHVFDDAPRNHAMRISYKERA